MAIIEALGRLGATFSRFVPDSIRADAESTRRAQLFIAFSFLGVLFGGLFGAFYLLIGYVWGAAIVFACTLALTGAPWIMRRGGLSVAGNIYAAVLVLGFTGLTAIEGGLHGHAVAWLAVVPLCACLLVGQRACWLWCGVCLLVVTTFCATELAGVRMPIMYPAAWEDAITSAGYLSLAAFMSMVGLSFESGRRRSLIKLHEALDALSAANARLHDLNQERSEFLGIAAHDLRTPLNSIVGFAQLMQRYSPGVDNLQRDSINRILNASGRMRDLLDRLLSVRAIEEGKLEMDIAPCDIATLAQTAIGHHLLAAQAKGIALAYAPPPEPMIALADAASLNQILDNLLSNAIKFSPPGRPVGLKVARSVDGRVRVDVEDAGPGLSKEDQKKLYGKFARLGARPTAGESSNGLGLSIVKRLAEAMDGTLNCRSVLGEGTTFSLTLNSAAPAALKPSAASRRLEGASAPVGPEAVVSTAA